jgi:hypothetical protein
MTNTVEGYFATLKRGVRHLPPDQPSPPAPLPSRVRLRYNARSISDGQRTLLALQGAEGKPLKYRETR